MLTTATIKRLTAVVNSFKSEVPAPIPDSWKSKGDGELWVLVPSSPQPVFGVGLMVSAQWATSAWLARRAAIFIPCLCANAEVCRR
jgi:hypothetical protein